VIQTTNQKRGIPRVLWVALFLLLALIGFVVWAESTARPYHDVNKSRAHLQCLNLSQACEAYHQHPKNAKHEYPRTPTDLHQPPWGGPSFLKNGTADLLDPWGKEYQFEIRKKDVDGTEYLLVKTTAPDGMPISNFGFGQKAEPTF
jgi:hypothetical protein